MRKRESAVTDGVALGKVGTVGILKHRDWMTKTETGILRRTIVEGFRKTVQATHMRH